MKCVEQRLTHSEYSLDASVTFLTMDSNGIVTVVWRYICHLPRKCPAWLALLTSRK